MPSGFRPLSKTLVAQYVTQRLTSLALTKYRVCVLELGLARSKMCTTRLCRTKQRSVLQPPERPRD